MIRRELWDQSISVILLGVNLAYLGIRCLKLVLSTHHSSFGKGEFFEGRARDLFGGSRCSTLSKTD